MAKCGGIKKGSEKGKGGNRNGSYSPGRIEHNAQLDWL